MIDVKVEPATGGFILTNGDEKCVATSLHALKEVFGAIVESNFGKPEEWVAPPEREKKKEKEGE